MAQKDTPSDAGGFPSTIMFLFYTRNFAAPQDKFYSEEIWLYSVGEKSASVGEKSARVGEECAE